MGALMMDATAFRHFYDYHFVENRAISDATTPLALEQFTQPMTYSHGSIRNQIVHLMSVDNAWFSGLHGNDVSKPTLLYLPDTCGAPD
jgi:hypothetical protein